MREKRGAVGEIINRLIMKNAKDKARIDQDPENHPGSGQPKGHEQ